MPGRKSKYTPRIDGELKMRVIAVLDTADDSVMPTLEWIKSQDMMLAPHTTQKLSRILGSLVELGLVRKGKSKSLGRMVYRLTSKMKEDGYDIDDEEVHQRAMRAWTGVNWEAEDEKNLGFDEEE